MWRAAAPYLSIELELCGVQCGAEHALRTPAKLITQRNIRILRGGETTTERSERDDLLALRSKVVD